MTTAYAARVAGISQRTIRKLASRGDLKPKVRPALACLPERFAGVPRRPRRMTWRAVRLDPLVDNASLFLWDEVAVAGLETKIDRIGRTDAARAANLNYLVDRGVLVSLPRTVSQARAAGLSLELPGSRMTTSMNLPYPLGGAIDLGDPELRAGCERLLVSCPGNPPHTSVALLGDLDPACTPRGCADTPSDAQRRGPAPRSR